MQENPTVAGRTARRRQQAPRGPWSWLANPRSTVLLILVLVIGVGGTRKLLRAWRARKLVARLEEPDATVEEILTTGTLGRAGLIPLFEILSTTDSPDRRQAAGLALTRAWASDDLIREEEQALVRRGFSAQFRGRRTYPRALQQAIQVGVDLGVPFLEDERSGVRPEQLEWSYRVTGTGRASLEVLSPWEPGPVQANVPIEPGDFLSNGPHRLVLQARVRTAGGLTTSWELDLPHIPFAFEFDPRLALDSLFTSPDASRAEVLAGELSLVECPYGPSGPPLADLGPDLVLVNPPRLAIAGPLPCDLAHRAELEIEGVSQRLSAGELVVPTDDWAATSFPLVFSSPLPAGLINGPGPRRVRCHLVPDAGLGWAHPGIRSVWPGGLETPWVTVQILRR